MKRIRLWMAGPVAAIAILLTGCSTLTGGSPSATIEAIGKNYANCDRTITYNAQVGAMNPGSGASVTGTINCRATQVPAQAPQTPAEIAKAYFESIAKQAQ